MPTGGRTKPCSWTWTEEPYAPTAARSARTGGRIGHRTRRAIGNGRNKCTEKRRMSFEAAEEICGSANPAAGWTHERSIHQKGELRGAVYSEARHDSAGRVRLTRPSDGRDRRAYGRDCRLALVDGDRHSLRSQSGPRAVYRD